MSKKVFKSSKEYKKALVQHWSIVCSYGGNGNQYSLYFYRNFDLGKEFLNRYYVTFQKYVYVPDLYFSNVQGYYFLENAYIPENDNGQWLDNVFYEAEEERIASEILDMDNTEQEFQTENQNPAEIAENIEEAINNAEKEEYFYSKDSALSHITINNEIFQLEKRSDGFTGTHVNANEIFRFFYDEKFRIKRKEIWNNTATENRTNTIYKYEGEEDTKPSEKIIELLSENPARKEYIFYNSQKLISKSEVYVIADEKDKTAADKTETITERTDFEYDSLNRVIKSLKKEYTYKNNDYKNLAYVFEKKYIYVYKKPVTTETGEEVEVPANTEYYEDNVLRMRSIYKTKDDYVKQFIFDDGLTITSYYEDDKLTKEIYRMDNKIIRIKNYDD